MHEMGTSEAREKFSEIVNRVAYRNERVVVGRRGKQLVPVVPLEDLKLLQRLDESKDSLEPATTGQVRSNEEDPTT